MAEKPYCKPNPERPPPDFARKVRCPLFARSRGEACVAPKENAPHTSRRFREPALLVWRASTGVDRDSSPDMFGGLRVSSAFAPIKPGEFSPARARRHGSAGSYVLTMIRLPLARPNLALSCVPVTLAGRLQRLSADNQYRKCGGAQYEQSCYAHDRKAFALSAFLYAEALVCFIAGTLICGYSIRSCVS